jgi:hypothetical protein
VELVVDPQRQIDHFDDLGDDLRAAAEPRWKVADVAAVLFDGDGQVFSGEKLVVRDEAVIALPIIGDERLALRRFCRGAFGMWRHHGDQEPRRWFAEQ